MPRTLLPSGQDVTAERKAAIDTSLDTPPQNTVAPSVRNRFQQIRAQSERLAAPLTPEDCVLQSMPDCSPIRWHLAHTTWFFETFVLKAASADYRPVDANFEYLFNSYYNSVGEQFPRAKRGLLSRPSVGEILEYRREVDSRIDEWFAAEPEATDSLWPVIEIGLQHEQQHQELMLTDLKHLFSCNPLFPVYQNVPRSGGEAVAVPLQWHSGPEGTVSCGHQAECFAYDNERPAHQAFLHPFQLASRLTTNGEFLEFVRDGGYARPDHWLSLGWAEAQEQEWNAPLYWLQRGGEWFEFTLSGLKPLELNAPVCHVSYFEADAFARWSGKRLPTEFEWEAAAVEMEQQAGRPAGQCAGNFVEQEQWHPRPVGSIPNNPAVENDAADLSPLRWQQLWGDVWEWTSSSYAPYPGYRTPPGAIGEYNGKFMCNQYVLRGGSCATPASHIRSTYRNFFGPAARWQFSGIRLAD